MPDNSCPIDEDEVDSIFEWFNPDGLPTLKEAAQFTSPSTDAMANGVTAHTESPEAEFPTEVEMKSDCWGGCFCVASTWTRIHDWTLASRHSIPDPDLSTRMEDLARHFPAELGERAVHATKSIQDRFIDRVPGGVPVSAVSSHT